ncbi:alginate export family protein [Thalassotalea ponticola]|uniref:alginate export family protein n=1 Tax=Thalassotalea ponticola TaxID=1523392 RepID=UPI0025B4305E|nr:alginate export family protein [Thalassotalea ponticola]MDN3651894.1 alginate export family protein [Thalassotalea ponticola]
MKCHTILPLSAVCLAMLASYQTRANTANSLGNAVKDSQVDVNFRYRLEAVDEDAKSSNALASTLKSRLTVTSGSIANISAKVELDNVTYIGSERFNSTVNGKTDYPVVADPDGTEFNQAFLQYHNNNLTFSAGRQRILLDDQRFVGGVAWRQNEQTFDGYRLQYSPFDKLSLDLSYIYNVNRIFGEDSANSDFHGDIYLLNGKYQINDKHSVTLYNYALDFDNASLQSSNTIGGMYQGQLSLVGLGLQVKLAMARQSDAGDNPNNYDADYFLAQVSSKISVVTFTLGHESLGSDNGVGFSTPLATLHAFQGFTDKFLNTPANGVVDNYLKVAWPLYDIKLSAAYHSFDAESGNDDYGDEVNFSAAYAFNKRYSVLAKAAHYNADDLASDTSKFWLMFSAQF